MNAKPLTVSWFSAGVSSAVATKLAIDRIDRIIYMHIDDQHEDTMRFVKDCESWFGKKVEVLQSPYKNVENALRVKAYGTINAAGGAACTRYLKQRGRREWELLHKDCLLTYVWGIDMLEQTRCEALENAMPKQNHQYPLVEKRLTKKHAHEILRASGIKRPAMYDLGYLNNNCIGCVKGGMGYWNKIRVDFPEVFEARAKLERLIGGTCINGVFLDELDPQAGRDQKPICDDCGIMCELIKL